MNHSIPPIVNLLIGVILISAAKAHPPVQDERSDDGNSPYPSALLLPGVAGPSPWSARPVLNDPSRFQIAIMTDRTGGHRPGIWMKGVERLNMLRPEFVVSVGDLIEGYTEKRRQLQQEWDEFLGFIDRLDMKFFFVAGNHDLSNTVMHDIWRERFGSEWYSFDYQGVHFLCLCSEDPVSEISDKQLEWIEKDLAQSVNARWTLVFLHKPLWPSPTVKNLPVIKIQPVGQKSKRLLVTGREQCFLDITIYTCNTTGAA